MTSFYSESELKEIGFKHVGTNVLLSRQASIYSASKIAIGNHVRIDDFCILSGNLTIGNHVHIAAACLLFGGNDGIIFEDYTGLSSRSAVYAESDDYAGTHLTNPTLPAKYRHIIGGGVLVKKHAIIGTGCSVLPNVVIGEGCAVGSMSLVSRSLDSWGIYAGIPCRRIKNRSQRLLQLEQDFQNNTQ